MKIGAKALYWLAGLLEGEGYFGTINSWVKGKCYRYPRIGLSMVDRDVVEHVGQLWDVKVQTVKNGHGRLPIHRVYLIGSRAAELMKQLRPLMGNRRREMIDLTLEEYVQKGDPNERRRRWSQVAIKGRPRNSDGTFSEVARI